MRMELITVGLFVGTLCFGFVMGRMIPNDTDSFHRVDSRGFVYSKCACGEEWGAAVPPGSRYSDSEYEQQIKSFPEWVAQCRTQYSEGR